MILHFYCFFENDVSGWKTHPFPIIYFNAKLSNIQEVLSFFSKIGTLHLSHIQIQKFSGVLTIKTALLRLKQRKTAAGGHAPQRVRSTPHTPGQRRPPTTVAFLWIYQSPPSSSKNDRMKTANCIRNVITRINSVHVMLSIQSPPPGKPAGKSMAKRIFFPVVDTKEAKWPGGAHSPAAASAGAPRPMRRLQHRLTAACLIPPSAAFGSG